MRFAIGGIVNETNTFATGPVGPEAFLQLRGDECFAYVGTNHSLGGALDGCRNLGIEPVPTLYADAFASGLPSRAAFGVLLDELAGRIADTGSLDGVILTLHGAMAAEGVPDAEAAIARRIRAVVGPATPIAVTLDFHANIGQVMVDAVEIVTTYDTYPHRDEAERAREAVTLLARTARGEIQPTAALVKPPMMPVPQGQHTDVPPFKNLHRPGPRDGAARCTHGQRRRRLPLCRCSGRGDRLSGHHGRSTGAGANAGDRTGAPSMGGARGDAGPQHAGRAGRR